MSDAFEEAMRAAENIAAGGAEDQAAATQSEEELRAAEKKRRYLALDMAMANVDRLRKDEDPKVLVDQIEAIFRQLHEAGVPPDRVDIIIDQLRTVTGKAKKILDEMNRRVGRDAKADRRRREHVEAAMAAAEAKAASVADTEIAEVAARYPLRNDLVYRRHSGKIWAGKVREDQGREVFTPLHTPFIIEGRLHFHGSDKGKGLRIGVRDEDGNYVQITHRRDELAGATDRSRVLARLMNVGMLITDRGKTTLLEMLQTSDSSTIVAAVSHAGFHMMDDYSFFMKLDGTIIGGLLPDGKQIAAELETSVRLDESMTRKGTLGGWKSMANAVVAHWARDRYTGGWD
jgi:hypothetical protein